MLSSKAVLAESQSIQSTPSLGVQLFTVSETLEKDFEGTLQAIRQIGYAEVETAGSLHRSVVQWRTALENAGLRCASVHLADDEPIPVMMDFAASLGARYVVTALYMLNPTPDDSAYRQMLARLEPDDYKRMGDQCNRLGEQARERGLQLAYHNENIEFVRLSTGTGYDMLLSSTDADLVQLELDCGWMIAAGQSPVRYLRANPGRIRMLHVKDFKRIGKPIHGLRQGDAPQSTELGRGTIDYVPIIQAAQASGVEHYFVEEEPPFATPPMQALAVDYRYTARLLTK
jgi:sugar phosphate isomerase/epimerase